MLDAVSTHAHHSTQWTHATVLGTPGTTHKLPLQLGDGSLSHGDSLISLSNGICLLGDGGCLFGDGGSLLANGSLLHSNNRLQNQGTAHHTHNMTSKSRTYGRTFS
jgi:hypothetical protein